MDLGGTEVQLVAVDPAHQAVEVAAFTTLLDHVVVRRTLVDRRCARTASHSFSARPR